MRIIRLFSILDQLRGRRRPVSAAALVDAAMRASRKMNAALIHSDKHILTSPPLKVFSLEKNDSGIFKPLTPCDRRTKTLVNGLPRFKSRNK